MAVALAIVASSCGGSSRPVAPAAPPAPRKPSEPPPFPEVHVPEGFAAFDRQSDGEEYELVDAGIEPRRVHRYSPVAGSIERMSVVSDNYPTSPRFVAEIEVEVLTVDEDWITYRSTIREMTAERRPDDPHDADAATRFFEKHVVGTVEVGYVSRVGSARAARRIRKAEHAEHADRLFVAMTCWPDLPSEALGVGAQWTQVHRYGDFVQPRNFRLVESSGDRVVVEEQGVIGDPPYSGGNHVRYEIDLRRTVNRFQRTTDFWRAANENGPAQHMTSRVQVAPIGP